MTIINTPTADETPSRAERRWHVLSIATLVVASVAAALSLVAVHDPDRSPVPLSTPTAVAADRAPAQQPDATAVWVARDKHAAIRYRTIDACGRPIVVGRLACD
jgi:hypothetical protein